LAVVEQRHFGRAAEELHLSQPTVSKAIKRLEQLVGTELIDRSTQPVSITATGASFADQVTTGLTQLDTALEMARQRARGGGRAIRVGYTADVGRTLIAEAISEVHRVHPDRRVLWMNDSTAEQLELVRSGQLDAGIGWLPPPTPGVTQLVLGSVGFAVLVPDDHPVASASSVSLAELPAGGLILWPRAPNPALFDRAATAANRAGLAPLHQADIGLDDLAGRVLAREALGLVPAGYAHFRQVPGLVDIPVDDSIPGVELVAFWRSGDEREHLVELVQLLARLAPTAIGPER